MMARKSGEGHYTGRDKGDLGVRDYERSDPPKRDVSKCAQIADHFAASNVHEMPVEPQKLSKAICMAIATRIRAAIPLREEDAAVDDAPAYRQAHLRRLRQLEASEEEWRKASQADMEGFKAFQEKLWAHEHALHEEEKPADAING